MRNGEADWIVSASPLLFLPEMTPLLDVTGTEETVVLWSRGGNVGAARYHEEREDGRE